MKSSSSVSSVNIFKRAAYNARLLIMRARSTDIGGLANHAVSEVQKTAELYEKYTGHPACNARVLEIGFGARPFRSYAMSAIFGSAVGIDLDRPAFRLRDVPSVWRANGTERAIKTFVRLLLFDRRELRLIQAEIRHITNAHDKPGPQLIHADAADAGFWRSIGRKFDLIVSDDVFEHISPEDLPKVVAHMKANLNDGGICIIRPFVFNGISGGHDIDAYPSNLSRLPTENAWRHLWDDDFTVNTYLNRISRRKFREIFAKNFNILQDISLQPDLGRDKLTADVREKVENLDEYELFSNKVEFILS